MVHADPGAAMRAFGVARQLVADAGTQDDEAAIEAAVDLATALPRPVLKAVRRYRRVGSSHEILLLRGLLPADAARGLEPTPSTVTPPTLRPSGRAAELLALAIVSLLGEPFTFASLYEGRLAQHVTAVPGQEDAQTSEGSRSVLDWHVEDAFTDDRADYFGLLCLRGAPDAATTLAPARFLQLPDRTQQVLREPRFAVDPGVEHAAARQAGLQRCSVLSGPPGDPEICYDSVYQQAADPDDTEAAHALAALATAIGAAAVSVTLEPGDLLITDNRRVVHGRTGYQPVWDGTGRWLLRVMACASSRDYRRRRGVRILPAAGA